MGISQPGEGSGEILLWPFMGRPFLINGNSQKRWDKLFSRICGERTRYKVYEDRFRLDIRKKTFLQ